MSLIGWQGAIKRMSELDVFYKENIEPLYAPDAPSMTYLKKELESHYWSEVSPLEYVLGY